MQNMRTFTLWIDSDVIEGLKGKARKSKMNQSEYVRRLFDLAIEKDLTFVVQPSENLLMGVVEK